MKLREFPRALLAALAVLGLLGALAVAETVYVKAGAARMVEKPDAYSKVLKRPKYREQLDRLEKGEKWDKVSYDGAVGYIRTEDLDTSKPKDNLNPAWSGGAGSSDTTFTAGTRALGPLGQQYTKENNLEKGRGVVEGIMDKMAPNPEKLDAFQREGRVGEFAGGEAGK
jgi:hypothetical protein